MTPGTSHQEICKESQIMTIRLRHAALRGFMMTILMTAPLSAYAREDHAPTNPRYETCMNLSVYARCRQIFGGVDCKHVSGLLVGDCPGPDG